MTTLRLCLSWVIILAARAYIEAHVEVNEDGCWIATTSGDGRYKHFWFLGRRYKAHVLAWLAYRGPLARNAIVDHEQCDNPPCCNPAHLRATTQSGNMKRCFEVGRGRSPFINRENVA